jgi:hypothetical protein
MTLDEFRLRMTRYREAADEEATSLKDPYLALDQLRSLYRQFDASERTMADRLLAEWVLSNDEKVRFEALVLIDDFHIKTAIPALRELAVRLASTDTPGAPYEQQKVNRIMAELSG